MSTTAYISTADARTLAALFPEPDFAALLAKTDDELAALLLAASIDLDAAMAYQGVVYEAGQDRSFPRYQRVVDRSTPTTPSESPFPVVGVWDWDDDANAAVVPQQVKIACIYQAASLLSPRHRERLEAIRSGLAAQSTGSLSETYLKPEDLPGGLTGLCDRSQRLMDKYRLRTSPLL